MNRPYIDADMCRSKWFAFHKDGGAMLDEAALLKKANDQKKRHLKVHAQSSGGRDDLFKYTPSKIGQRDGHHVALEPDMCAGIDFGSPICASPASVTSINSPTCQAIQEEEEDKNRCARSK